MKTASYQDGFHSILLDCRMDRAGKKCGKGYIAADKECEAEAIESKAITRKRKRFQVKPPNKKQLGALGMLVVGGAAVGAFEKWAGIDTQTRFRRMMNEEINNAYEEHAFKSPLNRNKSEEARKQELKKQKDELRRQKKALEKMYKSSSADYEGDELKKIRKNLNNIFKKGDSLHLDSRFESLSARDLIKRIDTEIAKIDEEVRSLAYQSGYNAV